MSGVGLEVGSDAAAWCAWRLDAEPELLVSLHQALPQRYPHLLQSIAHGTPQARYDILFAFPQERVTLTPTGTSVDFLAALDAAWRDVYRPSKASTLPFTGGWFLYLGYELAAQLEPSLRLPAQPPGMPVAFAERIPAALIRDHGERATYVVCETERQELAAAIRADLQSASLAPATTIGAARVQVDEDDPGEFLTGVARIKDYIRAGDVFQVNLSRAWRGRFEREPDPAALYRRLCAANPAPFAGICRWDARTAIISSSPERLVAVRDGRVTTRPIAGTHPRGPHRAADRAESRALLAHPKERAEHVMLIDLERNDLGRVCTPGSVAVSELMGLESYRHVHHIVSEVGGKLRRGVTPGQLIRAVFPGGTITGCPKVRCMEIIAELERQARGPYTGSMGYLNRDGSLDLNILIRTLWVQGCEIAVRAGAGIVADSVPERELAETRAKARGVLAGLGCG